MSLLGPRPVALSRAAAYEEAMAFLSLAKPGFIGPWWLVGKRKPDDIADELKYDLHYLRNYSLWLDVHILLQVFRTIAGMRAERSRGLESGAPQSIYTGAP
jgi:exopolysaccharide production protein ExoY